MCQGQHGPGSLTQISDNLVSFKYLQTELRAAQGELHWTGGRHRRQSGEGLVLLGQYPGPVTGTAGFGRR